MSASNREVFLDIYRSSKWRGRDSVSGPGSNVAVTAAIRTAMPTLLRALEVSTLLDAPCGDFHWMSTVDLPVERYIGVDVVPEVIARARRHSSERHEFAVADITGDSLPRADLILCRDCLVHLTDAQVARALRNMKRSGATFLLTTTFYALDHNLPGSTGGWRPLNLQLRPFGFPPPLAILPERGYDPEVRHSDKSLALWRLADVPGSLAA